MEKVTNARSHPAVEDLIRSRVHKGDEIQVTMDNFNSAKNETVSV